MKIRSLEIRNYRGHDNIKIEFKEIESKSMILILVVQWVEMQVISLCNL